MCTNRVIRILVSFSIFLSFMYFIFSRLKLAKLYRRSFGGDVPGREAQSSTGSSRGKLEESLNGGGVVLRRNIGLYTGYSRTTVANFAISKSPPCEGPRDARQHDRQSLLAETSGLLSMDKIATIYYRISLSFYSFATLKYSLICLLNFEAFRSFRWLDCYLFGHMTLSGRTTGGTCYVALVLAIFHLVWRVLMLVERPKFKLDCLEFLLQDLEGTQRKEQEASCRQTGKSIAHQATFEPLIHFKRINVDQTPQDYCLKPNRTSGTRKSLVKFTIIFYAICAVNMIVWIGSLIVMSTPILTTKRGFELNYSNCVEWILGQRNESDRYSHIYSMPSNRSIKSILAKSRQFLLPMEDFVELNAYHLARVLIDWLENLTLWMDTFIALSVDIHIGLISVADIIIYSKAIITRLGQLNSKLWSQRGEISVARVRSRSFRDNSCLEVIEMQSMLMDFFAQVNRYNCFASMYVTFSVALWLAYSGAVCGWTLSPTRLHELIDWYLLQVFATICLVIIIGTHSIVKVVALEIYIKMASSMALDPSLSRSRLRWMKLLEYYFPLPAYCFTIFNTIKVSWLLSFQLLVWVISGSLVISNLLSNYGYTSGPSR